MEVDNGSTPYIQYKSMTLAFGKACGGSTVVYTGTSLTLPQEVLVKWRVRGLTHGDLQARSG